MVLPHRDDMSELDMVLWYKGCCVSRMSDSYVFSL